MSRIEALERVAEAARVFLAECGRDYHAIRHNVAKQELRTALDALPASPAGETVEVRAGVYRQGNGAYAISGIRWEDGTHSVACTEALVAVISAEVPCAVPVVVATVEKQK